MDFKKRDDEEDVHRTKVGIPRKVDLVGTAYSVSDWEGEFAKEFRENKRNKKEISHWAKKAASGPLYQERHLLVKGQTYHLGILFARELPEARRTTEGILEEAFRRYGSEAVNSLKAEFAFLLRKRFSNTDLARVHLSRIIVPHSPLIVYDGLCWLRVDEFDMSSSVGTETIPDPSASSVLWGEDAAFAFSCQQQ